MVATINHIGLTVTDLQRSRDFYEEIVGFEFHRLGHKTGGEWFDTLTGNSGAVIDAVLLRDGDLVLQLVQYHRGGSAESVAGHHRVGNVHLCIDVEDVELKRRELVARGDVECTPIVDLPRSGARSFYVRDPDGTPVEFITLPS